MKPVPSIPVFTSIASIIEVDQLACEILRFLLANENAMDSAKGIAAWWVHTDELAVQPSLHRLFACGAILAHTLSSGTTVYGLTQDHEVRFWLRRTLQQCERSSTSDKPSLPGTESTTGVATT